MTRKIELLLAELDKNIPFYNEQNPDVSRSDIGWHIEHCLLVLDGVIARIAQSDSVNCKPKISLARFIVFTTGKIPRGRAKSPASVQPKEDTSHETLAAHIKFTKEKLKVLAQIKPAQYFEHPFFGHLKLKQTIKFLIIHTKHHLKIINDIKN